MLLDSSPAFKRRRFSNIVPMDFISTKEKLLATKEKFGREIRVFETLLASQTQNDASTADEPEDFYEFTPEDYYRILATKKQDKYLKTQKIRDAEEAARRSRITKAVIRVQFPDNHTLEASFHPSETIQSLVDLLIKVLAQPDLPFYIYTTPPKKQLKDMAQNFYSAGFTPGAIVYFSQEVPRGYEVAAAPDPFLKEEVMSLKGLNLTAEQAEPTQALVAMQEAVVEIHSPNVQERKPSDKTTVKPKWLRM